MDQNRINNISDPRIDKTLSDFIRRRKKPTRDFPFMVRDLTTN